MRMLLAKLRLRFMTMVDYGKSPIGALLLALFFGVLSIYATWFNDKKPGMAYAIALQTNLLSPHAPNEGITVQLNGKAIDVERTPLQMVFVRFWNSGDTTFRTVDFDKSAPIGFIVSDGKVLRAELVAASSEYLKRSMPATIETQQRVTVLPAIIEPNDAIVLKAVVLQDSPASGIKILPTGKIAGVESFDEYYPVTAESPEIILRYRSKSTSKIVLSLVAVLMLLNFFYSICQWRQKRLGKSAPVAGGRQ